MLSVVSPCFNEGPGLGRLIEVLRETLPEVTPDFEVILVDDGSSDDTLAQLRATALHDPRFRYVAFSRNFGKESAMLAGMSEAVGDAVAIIDSDLQHPPELLKRMLPLLEQGYDQVVAKRTRAGDAVARTLASRAYYRLVNHLMDVQLEDGVGDFRVLSRRAVNALLSLREYNRFSKGLFSWIGFDTVTVDYENVLREVGESKWGLGRLLNYGIDGVISFNSKPLRSAIHFGLVMSGLALLYALWIVVQALVGGVSSPGYVTIICAIVGFGGLQMIMLGVVGEYLGRIYLESKQRPLYLLKETSAAPRSRTPREDCPRSSIDSEAPAMSARQWED